MGSMPIYLYQIVHEDGTDGPTFEVIRKASDPPLERHPDTGQKCKRIYTPVHIAGVTNEYKMKARLDDKKLAQQGFTKFQRNGKGHYERTVGNFGPERISLGD